VIGVYHCYAPNLAFLATFSFLHTSATHAKTLHETQSTMKLDVTDLRYLSSDEFRVLTAVRFLLFFLVNVL
jgi:hypothetical protein